MGHTSNSFKPQLHLSEIWLIKAIETLICGKHARGDLGAIELKNLPRKPLLLLNCTPLLQLQKVGFSEGLLLVVYPSACAPTPRYRNESTVTL